MDRGASRRFSLGMGASQHRTCADRVVIQPVVAGRAERRLGVRHKGGPRDGRAARSGGVNNPLPILGRNIASIAPLANEDATLAYVGGKRFSVSVPDGVNWCQVRHALTIQRVSAKSIPHVSLRCVLATAWSTTHMRA